MINPWDVISERFNTHKKLDEVHPDAAVNIFFGWPEFFKQIKLHSEFLGKEHLKILDFGCGAGEFCTKLHRQGHSVIGLDSSKVMLEIARLNSPQDINYFHRDGKKEDLVEYKRKMDVITAIHVLDWIKDLKHLFPLLVGLLNENGLLMFAVFPKKHVIESLKIKDLFENFNSRINPTRGVCNFDGVRIPVYVREANFYDKLAKELHLEKVLEYYPQFTKEFISKYHWTGAKFPEMMILAYRKIPSPTLH